MFVVAEEFFLFLCFNVAVATDDATAVDDTTMFLFVTMYIKREYTQMTQFSSHAFEHFCQIISESSQSLAHALH